MEFEDLEREVGKIAEIASRLDHPYQEKCFEILLSHFLDERRGTGLPAGRREAEGGSPLWVGQVDPKNLKLVLGKTGASKEELFAVCEVREGNFRLLREPAGAIRAIAQIEWALLYALNGGLMVGQFLVDAEDVRMICKHKGCYDMGNFAQTFKSKKNAPLFKGVVAPGGGARALTVRGEAELGRLIESLARRGA